jgi:ribosome-binding protein aMBF1 (putative translation factor)
VKTIADWLRVKLHERKMAPYHLAAKMGIASSVVHAWRDGAARPKARQIRDMVAILGKYCRYPDIHLGFLLGKGDVGN